MLPQSNATLIAISAGYSAHSEDWNTDANSGTVQKWVGSEDAYYIEKTRTTYSAEEGGEGALHRRRDVSLILPATLFRDSIALEEGDILTYTVNGVQHSRRVMTTASAYLPGVPNYVRVNMNPEPVEIELEQN